MSWKHTQGAFVVVRQLQQVMTEIALDGKQKPGNRIAAAKAWDILQERFRILDGRPLPGSLRPESPRAIRWRRSAPAQVVDVPAQPEPAKPTEPGDTTTGCGST